MKVIFLLEAQILGILLALFAAASWGVAAVINKLVLVPEHSLLLTITIRGLIAVPFIGFVTFLTNGLDSVNILFHPTSFPILIFSSIFVGLGDLCFFGSLQRLNVSIAQPVSAIYPFVTAICLIVLGIEIVSVEIMAGTIGIILGISLVIYQKKDSNSSLSVEIKKNQGVGFGLALFAAFCWSLSIISLRVLLFQPEMNIFSLATIRFAILTIFFGVLWGLKSIYRSITGMKDVYSLSHITRKTILGLGLGGVLAWGFGGLTFFSALELIETSRATPISSINPLISVVIGIFYLKEKLTPNQAIGILLILSGSIIVSFL
ncbi:MAG: DMT family transporter [Candidatus Hodarchaeales archaeon]|jgi:DME family drug/metabolite transporter